jgi:putative drug exporter of the RND superfamily
MFVRIRSLRTDRPLSILVRSRNREETHNFPLTPAGRGAVHATGGTVTSAGLILAETFIASPLPARCAGLGPAAGIVLDTYLCRSSTKQGGGSDDRVQRYFSYPTPGRRRSNSGCESVFVG